MLVCPICSKALIKYKSVFKCENGHSFDVASSGYCNLLCSNKAGNFRGDTREMVMARRKFLDSGAYEPLRSAVCEKACELVCKDKARVLDAGCGEGYYTSCISKKLSECVSGLEMYGVDIAKSATEYASKRDKITQYITASTYHLPISDESIDLILSLFAPTPAEEFSRVLKSGGRVLMAVPGEEHLLELKKAVYDDVYLNCEDKHTLKGFKCISRDKLTYKTVIEGNDKISALFGMTPYSHRTPKEGLERLKSIESIALTLSFVLLVFEKE